MTKRQKFVISSIILALGFFSMEFLEVSLRMYAIFVLIASSAALTFWCVRSSLERDARLLVLILPVFFTAGVGFFYFLLPSSILTKIPVLFLYTIGIYALLLTANIYTVSSARTIALLRAAHAVGFLLSLLTSFLLFDTILSLRSDFWINGLAFGLISFLLLIQGLWSIDLEAHLEKEVIYISAVLGLVAAEVAAVLSFWPVTVPAGSLAVTTVLYIGLGLGQVKLQQRLFTKTVREYFIVGAIVFVTMFLTARWGG